MITKILQDRIDILNNCIKPTIDNRNQYESNVRSKWTSEFLSERLEFITKHKNYIGLEVFWFLQNFSVTTKADYLSETEDIRYLNPITETGFIYKLEDYNSFLNKYINIQIKSLTRDLIKNNHYRNSTNPLSNLEHQWITECKQNLIEFLSEIKLS